MMVRLLWLCAAVLLLCLTGARAEERITAYHARIEVAKDGTLTVTETIRANVEGNQIKRGIFRDIPLTLRNDDGSTRRVGFDLVSVKRDRRTEPYRTETINGGIRIYTGAADVFLPPGSHSFEITYSTDRQIRFLEDHVELYWNVTGNGWSFPIDEASATVILPEGVEADELAAYTGPLGSTASNASATEQDDRPYFVTTRPLAAAEGLTIAVKMPEGSIDPPGLVAENLGFIRDHLGVVIGFAGLLLVGLYYSRMWWRVGRDPERGVIVPRWDAPEGISPALVNYIDNRGFSGAGWTALSAAALDLAVRGHVVLEDLKSSLVITATGTAPPARSGDRPLAAGEAALMQALASHGGRLVIDRANGPTVQKVGEDFRLAMEKEHRGKYYKANVGYIIGGVVLSMLVLAGIFLSGSVDETVTIFIAIPVVIALFIGTTVVGMARSVFRKRSLFGRIVGLIVLAFFSFIAVGMIGGFMLFLVFAPEMVGQLPLLVAIGGVALVNALFFFLMGAPTPIGAKMMDGIDGLRQYLTLAEKERMNMQGAPAMSPQHFETLLPYAVALGVEKPWSRTFDTWLAAAAAGAGAAAYQPVWYHGNSLGAGSFGDRMGGFAGSMASTMSASLPPPPSSSSSGFSGSGGGGSSGGGGGGGGGGGW